MENAKRPDAVADELQQRANAWSQPGGFVFGQHVPFRFMHPPLLVPWSEIRVRRKKGWVFEYVTFAMGHELAIPLRIRGKLAAKLRESAGSYWPVEDVSEERDPMFTLPEAGKSTIVRPTWMGL